MALQHLIRKWEFRWIAYPFGGCCVHLEFIFKHLHSSYINFYLVYQVNEKKKKNYVLWQLNVNRLVFVERLNMPETRRHYSPMFTNRMEIAKNNRMDRLSFLYQLRTYTKNKEEKKKTFLDTNCSVEWHLLFFFFSLACFVGYDL